MVVDNSELIASLMVNQDSDVFWYAELLDRQHRKGGNNRRRTLKLLRFQDGDAMLLEMPRIRRLCDNTGCRAYLRLSPRSHKSVCLELLKLVADAVVSQNYRSSMYLYARACGRTNIKNGRTWLYDVDVINSETEKLGAWLQEKGLLVATIPSKKGLHYIVKPHDPRLDQDHSEVMADIQVHKDNPTNLYIPSD